MSSFCMVKKQVLCSLVYHKFCLFSAAAFTCFHFDRNQISDCWYRWTNIRGGKPPWRLRIEYREKQKKSLGKFKKKPWDWFLIWFLCCELSKKAAVKKGRKGLTGLLADIMRNEYDLDLGHIKRPLPSLLSVHWLAHNMERT